MDKIAILDCGGQYAHLIANRIRRLDVFSVIRENTTPASELTDVQGIIISGGPESTSNPDAPQIDPKIFDLNIPILGICYGHQLIAVTLGGKVQKPEVKEYGLTFVDQVSQNGAIFKNFGTHQQVWMSHWDEVSEIPEGFTVTHSSESCRIAAFANDERKIYGVQFHAEVTHTPNGMTILDNFLTLCGVKREWNTQHFLEEEKKKIIQHVGNRNVFLLTSGGVDSSVAFLLLSEVLGKDRVYGLFVDTGLMRKDEGKEVAESMRELGFDNLHCVDESELFLTALKDAYDPEEKRNIIGDLFLEVQKKYSEKLELDPAHWLLGQGTIYPDTIESGGTKHADKIKTHHNRVPQIEKLIEQGLVIEPVQDLYKDEVRDLGIQLGLLEDMVWRHPFPGPGLGVRILCAKQEESVENAKNIEQQIQEKHGFENVILPIKSVGVQGDERTYRNPLALQVPPEKRDWEVLEKISTTLTNSFEPINRVVLLLSPGIIPANITTLSSAITPERVTVLQEIDAIVHNVLKKHQLLREIWQFPVVLLPVTADGSRESIVLRPVCSKEAMTANFSKIEHHVISEMVDEIQKTELVSMVFFDITNKPPGTIEWE